MHNQYPACMFQARLSCLRLLFAFPLTLPSSFSVPYLLTPVCVFLHRSLSHRLLPHDLHLFFFHLLSSFLSLYQFLLSTHFLALFSLFITLVPCILSFYFPPHIFLLFLLSLHSSHSFSPSSSSLSYTSHSFISLFSPLHLGRPKIFTRVLSSYL